MSFAVNFDVVEVEGLRTRIDKITDESLKAASVRAVTQVAKRTYDMLIPRMTSKVNFSAEYVKERMVVTPVREGPKGLVEASIVAPIAKGSPLIKVNPVTTLRRYAPVQVTKAVNWPNGSFKLGRKGPHPTKPGSFLPWKARTGDALRGIPVNQKADGVSVEVLRGSRKRIASAFLLPLRRGREAAGNGLGVVQRGDDGKIRTLKGPMVYQVMRGVLPEIEDDIERDLRETATREVSDEIEKALKP